MASVVSHLLNWLGVGRIVTLVNNPQANGVERANQEILRHLQTIVADERVKSSWSDPTVISWIQIIMNSFVNSGTGYAPFTLAYGNLDHSSFDFPISSPREADEFCSKLAGNMKHIRAISADFQSSLKSSRRDSSDPIAQTRYECGDFVFYLLADKLSRGNKLNSLKEGPYSVVSHGVNSNVVSIRNLISDAIHEVNQKDLKIFHGTMEEAKKLALLDSDQHSVDCIVGYSGEPEKRSTLQFHVLFKDGDKVWLDYSPDLHSTSAFEEYCSGIPCLRIVLLKHDTVKSLRSQVLKSQIDTSLKGSEMYLNLRIWGAGWYNDLKLPNGFEVDYVCQAKITDIRIKGKKHEFIIKVFVFNAVFAVDNWFIHQHAAQKVIKGTDVLVTAQLCLKFGIDPKLRNSSSTHA